MDNLLTQFAEALATGKIRVIDLTQPLEPATPVIQLPPEFGKSWPFHMEEISKYDARGPAWYWNNFSCGEHTGTHFDGIRPANPGQSRAAAQRAGVR
jgi:kynurenine formamidase